MNRRIIAMMLTVVVVISVLSGCGNKTDIVGKKDSTYFKELKEISKIETGTSAITFDLVMRGLKTLENDGSELLKDDEGNLVVSVKVEVATANEKQVGTKFYAKLGKESDYTAVTTFVNYDGIGYMDVATLTAFIKKIDENIGTKVEEQLAKMGIRDAISYDIQKVSEKASESIKLPIGKDGISKETREFLEKILNLAEIYFADLQGQDGNDYTFTLNGDNVDAFITDTANFLRSDDAKELLDACETFMTSIYGKQLMESIFKGYSAEEVLADLPETAQKLEDSRADAKKAWTDANINIVSKAFINDGEGMASLDTGEIHIDDEETFQLAVGYQVKDKIPDVKSMIPENASDITTLMLTTLYGISAGAELPTGETTTESLE